MQMQNPDVLTRIEMKQQANADKFVEALKCTNSDDHMDEYGHIWVDILAVSSVS
jgi:hypothetical protein